MFRYLIPIFLSAGLAMAQPAQGIPAFPGAQGRGAQTPGGRGGAVVEVTNLNDAGPGSLREAMQVRTGPRIVVFRVGGTITLTEPIDVREPNSYLTVAGQTAPGDGIQIKNYGIRIRDGAHDVVLRYLRVRPGDTTPGEGGKDGVLVYGEGTRPVHDVLVDHCSIEWATDENVDVCAWVEDATFQWCLIAEGSMTGHPKGPHSFGLLLGADPRITLTVHHSLFAHNAGRNPRLDAKAEGMTDFRSNVVYNWKNVGAAELANGAKANFAGNVYLAGPDINAYDHRVFAVPDRTNSTGVSLSLDGNRGPLCPTGCTDDWDLGVWFYESGQVYPADEALYRSWKTFPAPGVETDPAGLLVERVLADVGATRPRRDPVDQRIVEDVVLGTGHVGIGSGYPDLVADVPPADRDHDGMPDAWERAYGLDRNDPSDAQGDLNGDGYTNVEEYLNDRDPTAPPAPAGAGSVPDGGAVAGVPLTIGKADAERLTLEWGASCRATDVDYEIYEGEIGRFASHVQQFCSTGGETTKTYRPSSGDIYFLVVPRDATREGSYGSTGAGAERPPSTEACLPAALVGCP